MSCAGTFTSEADYGNFLFPLVRNGTNLVAVEAGYGYDIGCKGFLIEASQGSKWIQVMWEGKGSSGTTWRDVALEVRANPPHSHRSHAVSAAGRSHVCDTGRRGGGGEGGRGDRTLSRAEMAEMARDAMPLLRTDAPRKFNRCRAWGQSTVMAMAIGTGTSCVPLSGRTPLGPEGARRLADLLRTAPPPLLTSINLR